MCECVKFEGKKVKDIYHDIAIMDDGTKITTEDLIHRYNALMDYFNRLIMEAKANGCGRDCQCQTDNIR